MYKFVKINCKLQGVHSTWFLEFKGQDASGITEPMNEKLLREVFSLHGEESKGWLHRAIKAATTQVDYDAIFEKYNKTLYIRPNGTYMMLSDREEIIEEVFLSHFPVKQVAEIVICENDKKEEYRWRKYLEKRFPEKKIKTINFFDLRSDEDILANFKGAKFITFSTTFSNLEWFNKLVKCKNDNQKIIGYCHDIEKWDLINEPIEIVTSI